MDARDLCRGETRESRGFLPLPQVMVDTLVVISGDMTLIK